MIEKDNALYVDICKAAEMLNVSVVTARKLLGKPDKVISTKYNLPHYLYTEDRLQIAIDKRKEKQFSKCEMCRMCHVRKKKDDLIGGRCQQCRADMCVLNFCRGNCLTCDKCAPRLLDLLKKSIAKVEASCQTLD